MCLTMRLFCWQQLPILILVQLLQIFSTNQKICAEALLAFKSSLHAPQQTSERIGRYPCIRQRAYLDCYKPKDPGFLKSLNFLLLQISFPQTLQFNFKKNYHKSKTRRIIASIYGDNDVPTLTPVQQDDIKKPRNQRVAAIVGSVGAALLVIGFVALVYIYLMRVKRRLRRSEGESSVPSPSADVERGNTSLHPGVGTQNLRQIALLELKQATNNFSESNIIGEGSFGLAYKGLLEDGSLVAIKRRLQTPIQNFFREVKHIACVHHRHLVKLVGYSVENQQQLLIYDYVPNGNVGNHLYTTEGLPIGKLTMRQRLSIALGAAKGLEHLHSLVPPVFHMHFRTSNVLLDENYTAKVSDYSLLKLVHHAGSSSAIDSFTDPELNLSKNYCAGSDVYSFGVFLLELISGQEAHGKKHSNSDQNLVLQVKRSSDLGNHVDKTISEQTLDVAKEMMELALQCVDVSSRRPSSMRRIKEELEGIQEREMGRLHSEFVEEIGAVKLGSELFK